MHSVRGFLSLWSLTTTVILGYAFTDLALHPALRRETNFSMQPDLARAGELVHWGGRLLKEGHWSLLVSNALLLGGLVALFLGGAMRWRRRERDLVHARANDQEARPSLP